MVSAKKRLIFVVLTMTIFAAICCGLYFHACAPASNVLDDYSVAYAEAYFRDGNGSETNPYRIYSAYDLATMADLVNADDIGTYRAACYSVECDTIDMDELASVSSVFKPIGTSIRPFSGTLRGNGVIIYNLNYTALSYNTCVAPGAYIGLFGYVGSGGRVYGIGISDGRYSCGDAQYVGGIVGYNVGTVEQCFFEGSVYGDSYVGGIVGNNVGIIRRCFTNGSVSSGNNTARCGGLVGYNEGSIAFSYTQCNVFTTNVGGAVCMGAVSGTIKSESNFPTYCYYNSSVAVALTAVGVDNGQEPVPDYDKMKGYTSAELDTASVSELFTSDANNYWVKEFRRDDGSGYVGPLLKNFDINVDSRALASAVTVRMYGINRESEAEWGTVANPYLISNATELKNLANAVNERGETYTGKTFKMTADINGIGQLDPIGKYVNDVTRNRMFSGTFDGANHTLGGFAIEKAAPENNYVGLFGYVARGGIIRNLRIANDCTVTGGNYIGSLIGYADGARVENIESRATVSASGNSGGILGYSDRGSYKSILSVVTLVAPASTSTMYGFAGVTSNTPSVITNVWYYAPDYIQGVANRFRSSNNIGAVMHVDTVGGSIAAILSDDLDSEGYRYIAFNATPYGDRTTHYRKVSEEIISENNYWQAPVHTGEYHGVTVYARFVRKIQVSIDGAADSEVVTSFREASDKYYVGQKYRLELRLANGFYISSMSGGTAAGAYSYESQNAKIIYSDFAETSTALVVHLQKITYDDTRFGENHTYNGNPVIFDSSLLIGDPPEGYRTDIIYPGGSAPVKASSEAYNLTVVMFNARGVRVGSRTISFKILPTRLYVNAEYEKMPNSKEWDNSDNAISVEVPAGAITGICGSDSVQITASMSFSKRDICDDADITYTYSLSGADAGNYITPSGATLSGIGHITKRNVYFSPVAETVEFNDKEYPGQEYNGLNAHFARLDVSGEVAGSKVTPIFEFIPVTRVDNNYVTVERASGEVGLYKVRIQSINDDAHYNAYFYDENGEGKDNIIYCITRKTVDVIYEIGGVSVDKCELIYNDNAFAARAYFVQAIGGTQVELSYSIVKDSQAVPEIKGAGAYYIKINIDGDGGFESTADAQRYILKADADNNVRSVAFTVAKASQNAVTAIVSKGQSGNPAYYGDEITFSYSGGTVHTDVSYELLSGDGLTGEGIINDSKLEVTRVGVFKVKVTLGGGENYLSVSSTAVFTVNKAALEVSFASDVSTDYLKIIQPDLVYYKRDTDSVIDEPDGLTGMKINITDLSGETRTFNAYGKYAVGVYTLSLDLSTAGSYGYELSVGDTPGAMLTISRRTVKIVAMSASSEYGKPETEISYEIYTDGTAEEAVTKRMLQINLVRANKSVKDVGVYPIVLESVAEDNPNFSIVMHDSIPQGRYTISAAKLTFKMKEGITKQYGDEDPDILPGELFSVEGLAEGESVLYIRSGEESAPPEGTYSIVITYDIVRLAGEASGGKYAYELRAGGAGITHNSSNYDEKITFEASYLNIIRCTPRLMVEPTIKLSAKSALSTVDPPQTGFVGADGESVVTGTASWKNGEIIPDFAAIDRVVCVAVFVPNDDNYDSTEFNVIVEVIPIAITAIFSGSGEVVYSGADQPDTEVNFVGVVDNDELSATVSYEGDRKNVGSYRVSVAIGNGNYKLQGATSKNIKIVKAKLTIAFDTDKIVVSEGETPELKFEYKGFVGADDIGALSALPIVADLPVEPGEYVVKAKNAASSNYDISYSGLKLIINRNTLTDESGTTLGGSFPPDVTASVESIDADDDIESMYSELQSAYKILANKSIGDVYKIDYVSESDDNYSYTGELTISIKLGDKYSDMSKVAFAAITYDGDIIYVSDVTFYDNVAELRMKNVEYVLVTSSEASGKLLDRDKLIYIGIAGGAAVAVIAVIIIVLVRRRRNARFIHYADDED